MKSLMEKQIFLYTDFGQGYVRPRRIGKAVALNFLNRKITPHQSDREKARRRRQLALGIIHN